ncbi:site-specific integrase [uncultured Duncaniella sp.]|uniref:site-specific integrase n=1 Tax=uncultured Duncaniella sp. TaxID=2768039 RepID=UPI00267524C1|nr:site-specific integrase [uncultured Duncaniella sp.]
MDICTKVTLRQRLLDSGKITLYFDYYPPIRNPKTNKMQRHEYLGIYLYGNPTNKVQRDFNQTMLEKGELLRCRRQEQVINRQFGFIDHSQQKEDFLAYYEEYAKRQSNTKWRISYKHFQIFTGGKCTFGEITLDLCNKFRDYLLNAKQLKHTKKKLSKNAASGYFSTFRALLKKAYKEKLLTENVNDFLEYIEWDDVVKEFLNQDELIRLAQTPCDSDVLRRASLFSCLTGLRFSDILNLDWKNIQEIAGIGLCVVIKTQKTKTAATLPLCEDAIELIGERKTGKVFPGFKKTLTTKPLRDWIKAANIDKHITFHCLRHYELSLSLNLNSLQRFVS